MDLWNATYTDNPRKLIDGVFKNVPNGFKLHKSYYPSFDLYLVFDSQSQLILYEFVKNKGMDLGSAKGKGQFRLQLAEDGNIYLLHSGKPVSFEEASRLLLEPLLIS